MHNSGYLEVIAISWPAFSRTTAEFVESRNNDSSFSIGPEIDALGIKWSNTFTQNFLCLGK